MSTATIPQNTPPAAPAKKEMRAVVIDELIELARTNPRIIVLDADVSKSTQTRRFGQSHPGRFYNVGVSEMNMASMAAGLAACGKTPIVSSFALFLSMRALEPIRTQISYPNLDVKIIGGYTGLSAHQHGPTHHCLQDSAIMRSLANFMVVSPSDWVQTRATVRWMMKHPGPVYVRLSYVNEPAIHPEDLEVSPGKAFVLQEGTDVALLTTGVMARRTLEAARQLQAKGISVAVVDNPFIKPLDEKTILATAATTRGRLVAIEEHGLIGGFASAVAELVADRGAGRVKAVGVNDRFTESAPHDQLLDHYGLSVNDIVQAAESLLNN